MPPSATSILLLRIRKSFKRRFSLLEDRASTQQIDTAFRTGVELSGTTPWVLILAIFIASIGLNVNSTAVIIGAMLISPLMGPIMGVGYGLGIQDLSLIKKSLLNIAIATGISLATSTAYFLLSPLVEAQSELLARTSPTIWDVLIAVFGGLAGAIGFTRKEKNNLIPGVAIATALMPPLCTAGYGLAKGQLTFFVGALYLFAINSVYIALSTMLVTRSLKLAVKNELETSTQKRIKQGIFVAATLTSIPSIILAYNLVSLEIFKTRSQKFLKEEFRFPDTHVAATSIVPSQKTLEVTLIGATVTQENIAMIRAKLADSGLEDARLLVHQGKEQETLDLNKFKENILSEIYRDTARDLDAAKSHIASLTSQIEAKNQLKSQEEAILREVKAQYPEAETLLFSTQGVLLSQDSQTPKVTVLAYMKFSGSELLSEEEKHRLQRWLRLRTNSQEVLVLTEPTNKPVHSSAKPKSHKSKPKI